MPIYEKKTATPVGLSLGVSVKLLDPFDPDLAISVSFLRIPQPKDEISAYISMYEPTTYDASNGLSCFQLVW